MSGAKWLTVAEVAALFDVDAGVVLSWIGAKKLAAVNVASAGCLKRPRWRVSQAAIEVFVAGRTKAPPPGRQRRTRLDVEEFY